jgi:hypothetical protein
VRIKSGGGGRTSLVNATLVRGNGSKSSTAATLPRREFDTARCRTDCHLLHARAKGAPLAMSHDQRNFRKGTLKEYRMPLRVRAWHEELPRS